MHGLRGSVCEGTIRTKVGTSGLQVMLQKVRCSELASNALSIRKETLPESERQILSRLRRTRNRVPVCFTDSHGTMDYGASWFTQGTDDRPGEQQRPLRAWQYPLGQPDGTAEQPPTTPPRVQEEIEEVYDILNAGPRHRFTANGLIVSNCREGYNDRRIGCVAVFRPVSKEASSLAEQMKGRGCRPLEGTVDGGKDREERLAAIAASEKPYCLIVDLVGITGLPDCASTVEIYAEGLPDKIIQRARDILTEKGIDEEADVEGAIEQAKREDADARAKAKAERERAEAHARELAERRAKAGAETQYTTHEVGYGAQATASPNEASEAQYHFMEFLGLAIRNTMLTKKQAGRIIDQIQKGMPLDEVAYKNGIDEWEPKGPTFKQVLALKGIDHSWVKSGADASALISAKKNVPEFEARMLEDIHKANSPERLTAIGRILVNVNKSVNLPMSTYGRIVAAGKAKRSGATTQEAPADDF